MRKHHSLIDKVYSVSNLRMAYHRAARKRGASGSDGISWKEFASELRTNIYKLSDSLKNNKYSPAPFKVISKLTYDHKELVLHIPSVADRVVEHAVRRVIEPIYEDIFLDFSSGYRPGRSRITALKRALELYSDDYSWLLIIQIKDLAQTIEHNRLLGILNQHIADGRLLRLISQDWQGLRGLPNGSALTPFLCNVYLDQIDRLLPTNRTIRFTNTYALFFASKSEAEFIWQSLVSLIGEYGLEVDQKSSGVVHQPHIENMFLYEGFFDN